MCADECVASVETTARPSLLQDYIEAAYLLTDTPEPRDMIEEASHTGFTPDKEHVAGLTMKYEATGALRLFHDAMLAPYPLHTRLTSCACLLRIWATELADEKVQGDNDPRAWPFQTWVSQSGLVGSICDCLQAGLEVSFPQVANLGLHSTKAAIAVTGRSCTRASTFLRQPSHQALLQMLSVTAMPSCKHLQAELTLQDAHKHQVIPCVHVMLTFEPWPQTAKWYLVSALFVT